MRRTGDMVKEKTDRIGIPWDEFKEEEIQSLIEILLHVTSYSNIRNLHKSDRANERGADITAEKDGESVAIAVKMKPDQGDRNQLLELSGRQEKRKIYAYIVTPTKKFIDYMDSVKNVEFWDSDKLSEFFIKDNSYLTATIVLNKHPLSKELVNIRIKLCRIWLKVHKSEKKKPEVFDRFSFDLLWRLKDISVELNKANELIQSIFEEHRGFLGHLPVNYFLRIFSNYMDRLTTPASHFQSSLDEFIERNRQLFYNSIIEKAERSHWVGITQYTPLNNIHDIDHVLGNIKRYEKTSKFFQCTSDSDGAYMAIHQELEFLKDFGRGIESIIDDVLEELERGKLHW